MTRISMSAVALAIGLMAAPQLFAQRRAELLVCRDGHVTSTRYGDEACRRHRGIDREATMRARRNAANGMYGANGVYVPNAQRGVYTGKYPTGANSTVYGGAYPTTTNGTVYGGKYPTTTNGTVYGGKYPTTANGTVYGGKYPTTTNAPVYTGKYPTGANGTVYGGTVNPNGTYHRDDDDHDGPGRAGRGHAYGHDKQKHDDKKHDKDGDRY